MSHGSLSTGLPYEGSPLENLTLSDPKCNNDSCKAFYDAHQLSQKLVSYNHQFDYGHYVSWFLVASLGVFSAAYWLRRWNAHRYRSLGKKTLLSPLVGKFVAAWRFIAYRYAPGWLSDRLGFPSTGALIFFGLSILYCSILTFAVRPYYRQHRGYGSPPLGVRTGLMAVALTPWIIALSGKANIITMLTGIGYEKLNIVHRWMSWLCLGLSVVHTVPFIVAPLRDGGPAQLKRQFYKPGGLEYTGTPPLGMLFGLVLLSIPWIRHRIYEGFYHIHFWLAVSYIGLMFWHCKDLGDSWAYMWASLAVWLFSIFGRVFWYNRTTNLGHTMFITSRVITKILPDGMIKLEMDVPEGFEWDAGQHVFLRIPKLSPWDNHPFTVANSLIREIPEAERRLRFFVRPYNGFTRRLHQFLSKNTDVQLEACVDGPYGTYHGDVLTSYDTLILIAGGGGISAILPWVQEFANARSKGIPLQVSSVQVYWSIRHSEALTWIEDVMKELDLFKLHPEIQFTINVTGEMAEHPQGLNHKAPARCDSPPLAEEMDGMNINHGRICFTEVLGHLRPDSRNVVIACGPQSLKTDLSNETGRAQKKVLRGEVKEIALRTETFGW